MKASCGKKKIKYQSQLKDWNYKYVVLYISLKHEELNRVYIIKTNSKAAAAYQIDSIFEFMACLGGSHSPFYIYTSGTLSKNMLFCMKKYILRISVVSYHWSGIVSCFPLQKQSIFTALMLYKIVETMTNICLTSIQVLHYYFWQILGVFY